jgi:hypothetical protein
MRRDARAPFSCDVRDFLSCPFPQTSGRNSEQRQVGTYTAGTLSGTACQQQTQQRRSISDLTLISPLLSCIRY